MLMRKMEDSKKLTLLFYGPEQTETLAKTELEGVDRSHCCVGMSGDGGGGKDDNRKTG